MTKTQKRRAIHVLVTTLAIFASSFIAQLLITKTSDVAALKAAAITAGLIAAGYVKVELDKYFPRD